ncbi:hypothetical protein PR048_032641 [Dryococelus australis]|uniref:Uncharacterized protein n=1 Tax=Dryococelus australis TaxID=614101 RepID=A0ABQ9G2T1_9NEOP|nr:hypothetical protein PR048_032641 [Dryococelus australis]
MLVVSGMASVLAIPHTIWLHFDLRFPGYMTCFVPRIPLFWNTILNWTDELTMFLAQTAFTPVEHRRNFKGSDSEIGESEIQNYAISLAQHFYIGTKIKLNPGSELGSFDLGSGKMLVQPGTSDPPKIGRSSVEAVVDEGEGSDLQRGRPRRDQLKSVAQGGKEPDISYLIASGRAGVAKRYTGVVIVRRAAAPVASPATASVHLKFPPRPLVAQLVGSPRIWGAGGSGFESRMPNRQFRRFEMNFISISSPALNWNGATVFCVDLRSELGSNFEPRCCNRALADGQFPSRPHGGSSLLAAYWPALGNHNTLAVKDGHYHTWIPALDVVAVLSGDVWFDAVRGLDLPRPSRLSGKPLTALSAGGRTTWLASQPLLPPAVGVHDVADHTVNTPAAGGSAVLVVAIWLKCGHWVERRCWTTVECLCCVEGREGNSILAYMTSSAARQWSCTASIQLTLMSIRSKTSSADAWAPSSLAMPFGSGSAPVEVLASRHVNFTTLPRPSRWLGARHCGIALASHVGSKVILESEQFAQRSRNVVRGKEPFQHSPGVNFFREILDNQMSMAGPRTSSWTSRMRGPPIRVIEVSMERRRNESAEEPGDPRENSPTNGIVRHDSHLRKSDDPARD